MNTRSVFQKLKEKLDTAAVSAFQLAVALVSAAVVFLVGVSLYQQHAENVAASEALDAEIAMNAQTRENLDSIIARCDEAITRGRVGRSRTLLARLHAASSDDRIDVLQERYEELVKEKADQRASAAFDVLLRKYDKEGCVVAEDLWRKLEGTPQTHPRFQDIETLVQRLDDCRRQMLKEDLDKRLEKLKVLRQGFANSIPNRYADRHTIRVGVDVVEIGHHARLMLYHPVFDNRGEAQGVYQENIASIHSLGFTSVKFVGNQRSWLERVSEEDNLELATRIQREQLPEHRFRTWSVTCHLCELVDPGESSK